MANEQINQYTKTRTSGTVASGYDYMDIDSSDDSGVSYESAKMLISEFETYLNGALSFATDNFYTADGSTAGVRTVTLGADNLNWSATTADIKWSTTGDVDTLLIDGGTGSMAIGGATAPITTKLNITTSTSNEVGLGVNGSSLAANGIGLNIFSNTASGSSTGGDFTASTNVDTGGYLVGVESLATGSNTFTGNYNYGVWGKSNGGNVLTVGVRGEVLTGGSVTPGSTFGVMARNDSSKGLLHYGVYSQSSITSAGATLYGAWSQADGTSVATNVIAGYFEAINATNNYAIVTNGGNVGFGTVTPSNQALLELTSTTQAFLVMRMTGAEAIAITPADGMILYATSTSGAISSVGFWVYEAGAWRTM